MLRKNNIPHLNIWEMIDFAQNLIHNFERHRNRIIVFL